MKQQFLAFLVHQDSNAGTELIVFKPNTIKKVRKTLNATWVEEIYPVVTENVRYINEFCQ